MSRPRRSLHAALALLVASTACDAQGDALTLQPRYTLAVTPASIAASAPGEIALVATIEGRDYTPAPVRWRSTAPDVVALDTSTTAPHRVVARVLRRGVGTIVVTTGTATLTVPITTPAAGAVR